MPSELTKQECLDEASRCRAEAHGLRRQAHDISSAIARAALLRGAQKYDAMAATMEKQAQREH
jgi:hypothetical protein